MRIPLTSQVTISLILIEKKISKQDKFAEFIDERRDENAAD
ncbi:hypothetical protein [Xenorhabdus bovienii]|nr:hypothetical protein [Xenorhabdus bovienii]